MDTGFIQFFSIALLILGLLGTILPVLPGLLLSLCGLLIYKFGLDAPLSIAYIWIFVLLTLISTVLNYIIPAKTNKKFGGTRYGSIGSVIGTLVGMFCIPLPFGFLIGMLAGVFLGELLHDINDKKKAWNSVKGAIIGFFLGAGFNFIVAMAMLLVVTINMFRNI